MARHVRSKQTRYAAGVRQIAMASGSIIKTKSSVVVGVFANYDRKSPRSARYLKHATSFVTIVGSSTPALDCSE